LWPACAENPEPPLARGGLQRGTHQHQEAHISALTEVTELVRREQIESPAIIVVGEVVRLCEQLQWFKEFKAQIIVGLSLAASI